MYVNAYVYKLFSPETLPSPVWMLTRSLSKEQTRISWHPSAFELRICKTLFKKMSVEWTVLCAIPSVVSVAVKMLRVMYRKIRSDLWGVL